MIALYLLKVNYGKLQLQMAAFIYFTTIIKDYLHKMADLYLNYQRQCSVDLNSLLDQENLVILTGPERSGKKYIIENLQVEGLKLPIIPAKRSLIDLILYLNTLLTNKKGVFDIRVSHTINKLPLTFGVSMIQLLNCVIDKFKLNFQNPKDKALRILKKLAGFSTLIFPVAIDRDIDDEYFNFLTTEAQNLSGVKTILIINSNDLTSLKSKGKTIPNPVVTVLPKEQDFRECFSDILSIERIGELLSFAGYDVGIYAGFYEYVNRDKEFISADECIESILLSNIETLRRDHPQAKLLADFLSFFESEFTKSEIDYIYEILKQDENIYAKLNELTETLLQSKILKENKSVYNFLIFEIKKLLRQQNELKQKEYYAKIETCISALYPMDYESRYFYALKSENRQKSDDILFAWRIHLLRVNSQENNTSKYNFFDSEFNKVIFAFQKAYESYYSADYISSCKYLKPLLKNDRTAVNIEANYLGALCLWKLSGTRKQTASEFFSQILKSHGIEWETEILTKLCLISVYVNNAKYIKDGLIKAEKYFVEIQKLGDNQSDLEIIQNVLKRKAAAIFDSQKADSYLLESYQYFKTEPPVFEDEYVMASCNFAGNALTLGEFDKSYQILTEAIDSNLANKTQWIYLKNNLMLSKWFLEKTNEREILEFANYLDSLDDISEDAKILPYMNLGTMLFILGNDKGRALYNKAIELNEECPDDYYDYYYHSNLAMFYFLKGDLSEAQSHFALGNFVPEMLKPLEAQYFLLRNRLIKKLIECKKAFSYDELSKYFKENFEDTFNLNETSFYCTPYLFSDLQFWTEN